jgi:hypothetical protein
MSHTAVICLGAWGERLEEETEFVVAETARPWLLREGLLQAEEGRVAEDLASHRPRVDHRHVVQRSVRQVRSGLLPLLPVRDGLGPVLQLLPLNRVRVSPSPGRYELLANNPCEAGARRFAEHPSLATGSRIGEKALAKALERGDIRVPQQSDADEWVAAAAGLRDDPLGLRSRVGIAHLTTHDAAGVAIHTEGLAVKFAMKGVADGEDLSTRGIHPHAKASQATIPVVRPLFAAPSSQRVELLDVQEDEIGRLRPRALDSVV